MSDPVTLQAQISDYQRVGQQMAVENFGLRNELAVCVRAINELRSAVARLTEERDHFKEKYAATADDVSRLTSEVEALTLRDEAPKARRVKT